MSIANTIKVIQRMESRLTDLQDKYRSNALVSSELKKLLHSIKELESYLNKLDHLSPNYNTNEINSYVNAIALHVDILKGETDKGEFEKKDFAKIKHSLSLIKTMLSFHPTKYSHLAFITGWLMEWLYFI